MTTPLNIAVDGYLCDLNTISIASNGYLCKVYIEDGVDPRYGGYIVRKGMSTQIRRREREKRERELYFKEYKDVKGKRGEVLKMITVIITKNDKDFIKSKMVYAKPDLSVSDIDIQVTLKNDKPKITIKLL